MPTNVLLLPQLDGTRTTFTISQNCDWVDTLYFTAPGSSQVPLTVLWSITSGQNTLTITPESPILTTVGLVPGMAFGATFGFPNGGFIGTIVSSTQITVVNSVGGALFATITSDEIAATFSPLILDLTGITFHCHVRHPVNRGVRYLAVDTIGGLMINGGTSGALSFNVLQETIALLPIGTWVLDIIAVADGRTINLFPTAPCTVIVVPGVTLLS